MQHFNDKLKCCILKANDRLCKQEKHFFWQTEKWRNCFLYLERDFNKMWNHLSATWRLNHRKISWACGSQRSVQKPFTPILWPSKWNDAIGSDGPTRLMHKTAQTEVFNAPKICVSHKKSWYLLLEKSDTSALVCFLTLASELHRVSEEKDLFWHFFF